MTHDPIQSLLAKLESAGCDPKSNGPDSWESRCPAHDGTRRNLTVSRGEGGKALVYCHHEPGCSTEAICEAVGLRPSDLFAQPNGKPMNGNGKKPGFPTADAAADWIWSKQQAKGGKGWYYHDTTGQRVMLVIRSNLADGSKTYTPAHVTPTGWRIGDPKGKLPLYRLHRLADAGAVIVCEGEKAADAAESLGLVVTTSAHGAKSPGKTDWTPLAGREVAIVPDNDGPGEAYAVSVAQILSSLTPPAKVRIVHLANVWPGPIPAGADIADWVETGQAQAQTLLAAVTLATPWIAPDTPAPVLPAPIVRHVGNDGGREPEREFPLTELGNAERIIDRFGDRMRYCHPWKSWLIWDGRRWQSDDQGEARRLAIQSVRAMYAEVENRPTQAAIAELVDWAKASETRRRIEAALFLGEVLPGVPILPASMDSNPWDFNVANGTIDLRTGTLRPHRREDLITKLCPWEYHPDATCPLWESTLETFFARADEADRDDLISYWRRICGYAMTGVIREHVLPVAYGTGSNGKSTIINAVHDAFGGDYAIKAPPDLLMARNHEGHPTERTDLFGKRLVVAIETEQGRRFNETLVKELTGGDPIRARRMREDFWQFNPTHTIVMATNHKPVVRGTDRGIWRRLKLVPFTVALDDAVADKGMAERLRNEMPGILAWCVRGCLEWQEIGLQAPPEVEAATAEYRSNEDKLGMFIEEHCITSPDLRVKAGQLYETHKMWAESTGEHPMTMKALGTALEERGIRKVRSNGFWYLGIGLAERTYE